MEETLETRFSGLPELVMLYKPNFCCNCGEKIDRVEWNLLTSRRFCPSCDVEQRRHDLLPRIAVVGGTLAAMFGFGSFWAGSSKAVLPKREAPVGIRSAMPAQPPQAPSNVVPSDVPVTENGTMIRSEPEPPTETAAERTQASYFCGALTRKGTPCSRKVKVKGSRCFQHEGRPEAPKSE